MRKRLKKSKNKHFMFFRVGALFLVLIIFLVFCDTRVRPVIKRKVRDCARTETITILNKILLDEISSHKLKYSDFVTINYGDDNKITSIETNTVNINKFKASFAISITNALYKLDDFDFYIRFGTLIGPEFLTERGPKIHFKVSGSEYVRTEILSRFSEAGINQTIHKILLEVTLDICCYFPGYTTSVTVSSELLLAETVIIGTVPSYYREQ